MTGQLDQKLVELKKLEDTISSLTIQKEKIRKEVFSIIEEEKLDQYKNDLATISRIERKTIKYNKDQKDVLAYLESNKLVKYFDVVPEHREINANFEKDIKAGNFVVEGVEVETKTSPMIRFSR
jgi:hypothetical protein